MQDVAQRSVSLRDVYCARWEFQNANDTLRDARIQALMRNGLQEKKRSFFVVVGDRPKDVIVNLHFIMSSMDIKQNKSVLWAYKTKLLGFTR